MAPPAAGANDGSPGTQAPKRPLTQDTGSAEQMPKKVKIEAPDQIAVPASVLSAVNPPAKSLAASGKHRPPPRGWPEVWATNRSDLNETLDYFRQRQGGNQTNDGVFRGSLMANDPGQRPYMDGELIITRAGGGMEPVTVRGQKIMKQMKPQEAENATVKAFWGNMESRAACAIILSKDCHHCPIEPPYPYSVMAHFRPVMHWYEKDNGHLVSRFRWEKDDLDEEAWWVPEDYPSRTGPVDYTTKAQRQTCQSSCGQTHPRIFDEGFVCVTDNCDDFWKLDGNPLTNADTLTYNPVWLAERTQWPDNIIPPFALCPKPLSLTETEDPLFYTKRAAYKGMVCPDCGCCIARTNMEGWTCETEGCNFTHPLPQMRLDIRDIEKSHAAQPDGHAVPNSECQSPITHRRYAPVHGPWRIETYDVGGLPGCLIKQFHANAAINSRPGSADAMYSQMSDPALHLERRELHQSVVAGQRCNHFSNNFGLPYEFSAEVPSTAFKDAPDVVLNALRRMTWAGRVASEGTPLDHLNELLILGYLEGQAIGYHDDGEDALGPTIVTLSLGSHAIMSIRLKAKYYYGATGNSAKTYDPTQPIIPGCLAPDYRRYMNRNWARWNKSNRAEEFQTLKQKRTQGSTPPVCFKTTLCHGDYVVMHGSNLQKYFEHQITNDGRIRFALTARHVRPEAIKDPLERAKGDYTTNPEDEYHGNMEAFDLMKMQVAEQKQRRATFNAKRARAAQIKSA
ncbi:MAG: hypothetical protein Q9181_000523 [Wetmoreana brouardii]